MFRISVYYLDRLGLFKLVCDTWRICYENKVVAYSCVPSLSSLARIIYFWDISILVRISIDVVVLCCPQAMSIAFYQWIPMDCETRAIELVDIVVMRG